MPEIFSPLGGSPALRPYRPFPSCLPSQTHTPASSWNVHTQKVCVLGVQGGGVPREKKNVRMCGALPVAPTAVVVRAHSLTAAVSSPMTCSPCSKASLRVVVVVAAALALCCSSRCSAFAFTARLSRPAAVLRQSHSSSSSSSSWSWDRRVQQQVRYPVNLMVRVGCLPQRVPMEVLREVAFRLIMCQSSSLTYLVHERLPHQHQPAPPFAHMEPGAPGCCYHERLPSH